MNESTRPTIDSTLTSDSGEEATAENAELIVYQQSYDSLPDDIQKLAESTGGWEGVIKRLLANGPLEATPAASILGFSITSVLNPSAFASAGKKQGCPLGEPIF